MQQVQATYFVNNKLSLQAQSSYTIYSRAVSSTIVSQKTGAVSLDPSAGSQSVVDFNGFTFRATAQYKLSGLISFQPGTDINLESGKGERLKEGKNDVNDYAFFLTSEITPNEKINIRPGIRVIQNSVYDAPPFVPSINTKFALNQNLDLRLSYANGFRSPSLRELYFNFIDANHKIIGNPDLKAETSHSFNGSLNWKKSVSNGAIYSISLSGFYNNVKNLIDYAFSATTDTVLMANIANSKTRGATLSASYRFGHWNITAGTSLTGFYNDYSATDESLPVVLWSPEATTAISYSFNKAALDVNLFYKFTGRKPYYATNANQDIVLARLNNYHMADFTINKKLFRYFIINAGIRNLFDIKGVTSTLASGGVHGSNGITNIGYGRSYFAGLAFNWEKK
jgi:outer membrane receptor for ferrienterochelin and colicins